MTCICKSTSKGLPLLRFLNFLTESKKLFLSITMKFILGIVLTNSYSVLPMTHVIDVSTLFF